MLKSIQSVKEGQEPPLISVEEWRRIISVAKSIKRAICGEDIQVVQEKLKTQDPCVKAVGFDLVATCPLATEHHLLQFPSEEFNQRQPLMVLHQKSGSLIADRVTSALRPNRDALLIISTSSKFTPSKRQEAKGLLDARGEHSGEDECRLIRGAKSESELISLIDMLKAKNISAGVINHPYTSTRVNIHAIKTLKNVDILIAEACNSKDEPFLNAALNRVLEDRPEDRKSRAVNLARFATAPILPQRFFDYVLQHPTPVLAFLAAQHPSAMPKFLESITKVVNHPSVLATVASRPDCPAHVSEELARNPNPEVQHAIIGNRHSSQNALKHLITSGNHIISSEAQTEYLRRQDVGAVINANKCPNCCGDKDRKTPGSWCSKCDKQGVHGKR